MSQRIEKLQKLARDILSDEIRRLKDPRIGFVTISSIRMTSDLGYAKVYVTTLGTDDERKATLAGLRSASPHLRRTLGKEMHTRQVPELTFIEDDLQEKAMRVEEILHQIHEQDAGEGSS